MGQTYDECLKEIEELRARMERADARIKSLEEESRRWQIVARARLDEQSHLMDQIDSLTKEIKPLRVIKAINDFTEEEEKELDSLRARCAEMEEENVRLSKQVEMLRDMLTAKRRPFYDDKPPPCLIDTDSDRHSTTKGISDVPNDAE